MIRRALSGGVELDDDPERVDVDAVHRFLAEDAYWVRGRDRATIERLILGSTRVVAAYEGARLVGFARVSTRDAHGLYARFGFEPADPGRTMTRKRATED